MMKNPNVPGASTRDAPRKSNAAFLRVGVTGGIGSGKSTVCAAFATMGRTLLSADEIAREITEEDAPVRRLLRESFGDGLFSRDGKLDRRKLAEIVFSDPKRMSALNGIVHPAVFRELQRRIDGFPEEKRRPYVVIEAALIFETGMEEQLDFVLVVTASERTRIARVMARDGSSREAVLQRMSSQLPPEKTAKRAQFVIVNDVNTIGLEEKVRFIDSLLTRI